MGAPISPDTWAVYAPPLRRSYQGCMSGASHGGPSLALFTDGQRAK